VTAELLPSGYLVAPKSCRSLSGYEIHMGETMLGPQVEPFARIVIRSGEEVEVQDGAVTRDGRVFGTYLHGVFQNALFRAALLNRLRRGKGLPERAPAEADDPFDKLAAHLEAHLDMERLLAICGVGNG
jgi:adenosylcobyric acid synthase